MSSISLCMIVKNEEATLAACLASVADAVDEIIIVDTGSTDRTVEIAKGFTDKIFHFEWVNNFAAARNFAFSKGTKDFLMWLDADDIISRENCRKLIELKKNLNGVDVVYMLYHYSVDESGKTLAISTRERLLRRGKDFMWSGAVHEAVDLSGFKGNFVNSDIFITHTKNLDDPTEAAALFERNIIILEREIQSGMYTPREMYYYAIALASSPRRDEALPYLLKFIENPGSLKYTGFAAHLHAFNILLRQGQYNEALRIMEDYEDRNKHLSEYYCTLAVFYHKLERDIPKAVAAYEKALKCTGTEPGGIKADVQQDYYYDIPLMKLSQLSE